MEVSAETADLVVKEGVQLSEQAIRLLALPTCVSRIRKPGSA